SYSTHEGALTSEGNIVPAWQVRSPEEEQFKAMIDGSYAFKFARKLSSIKTYERGFRMGGTPAAKQAADMVYKEMRKLGLEDVQFHTFPVYGWEFKGASIEVEGQTFEAISLTSTPGTPPEGVTGELVFAGNGTMEDYADLDIDGKVALVAVDYDLLPWPSNVGLEARVHGTPAALIIYNLNYYGQDPSGEAFTQQDWSGTAVDFPVLNVPKNSGERLKSLATSGRVMATVKSKVNEYPDAKGYNVLGFIRGSEHPDEYIITGGHLDAYFEGFQDDALACGVALAIAKAMKETGYRPKHTIVFAIVDAEEFGAKGAWHDWLIGSWNLINDKTDWHDGLLANVNLELMGYKESEQIETRACDELLSFLKSFASTYKPDPEAFPNPEIAIHHGVSTWTDEWSYSYFGMPTICTKTDDRVSEEFYHSQFDTWERADPAKAQELAEFYGTIIMRIDNSLIHPYDLTIRPARFMEEVDRGAAAITGTDISNVIEAARRYEMAAAEVMQALVEAEEVYVTLNNAMAKAGTVEKASPLGGRSQAPITKAGTGTRVDGKSDETSALAQLKEAADKVNKKLRALNRYLYAETQFLGSTYPEEVVFQTTHYQHDPVVFEKLSQMVKSGDVSGAASLISDWDNGVYGNYYAPYHSYDVWTQFILKYFNNPDPKTEFFSRGRQLRFHDVWRLTHELMKKAAFAEQGGTVSVTPSDISKITRLSFDALKNYRAALDHDRGVWVKAMTLLPTVEELKELKDASQAARKLVTSVSN
ncbi:MAG TPA: M28 family peptidase, partial [Clostridia bacterium]|nr:M28 family peptidase [Clostridia bacterium]